MIRLVARRAEEHMNRVADDFCDRSFMREDDVGHRAEIFVEHLAQHRGVETFDEGREAGDVGEQRRDLAALAAEIERRGIAGEARGEIGREIARQRRVGALGRRLPTLGFAQHLDMADRLFNRGLEIGEVDRLRQEIEGPAIHRGADIGHVAIGRDDHGRDFFLRLLQLGEQRQTVHARHVDVGEHEVDIAFSASARQSLDAVVREQEARSRRRESACGIFGRATPRGRARRRRPKFWRSCDLAAFGEALVDLAAQRAKIDRLGDEAAAPPSDALRRVSSSP